MGFSISGGGIVQPLFVSGKTYNSAVNGTALQLVSFSHLDFRLTKTLFGRDLDFSQLSFNVTTIGTATLAKVYIFDSDDYGFPNNVPVFTSSDQSITTTGIKSITTSYTFKANKVYWVGLQPNGTVTLRALPPDACYNIADISIAASAICIRTLLVNFNPITNFNTQIGIPSNFLVNQTPVSFSFLKV